MSEVKQPQAIEVGNIYAIVQGDDLVNVEVEFNKNLTGANTAANVLTKLSQALGDVGWSTRSVMRVADRDAQAQANGDQDGDTGGPDVGEDTSDVDAASGS